MPGDFLSPGSKKEVIKLGELKSIGINERQKILQVQESLKNCKNYQENDSQAKCNMEKILLPRFLDKTKTTLLCEQKNITERCMIPQAFDILNLYGKNWIYLLPPCTQENEYDCMTSLLR